MRSKRFVRAAFILIPSVDQFVFSFPANFAALGAGRSWIPFHAVKDYENWEQRMKLFPNWVNVAIDNMNQGISKGNTSPRAAIIKVPPQLQPHHFRKEDHSMDR